MNLSTGRIRRAFRGLWIGATKKLSRSEAIEQYIILRLRTEDINRLDFLVKGLDDRSIVLPRGSPFSGKDLKDTARTAFLGWLASLTERDRRTVYAFDCLFVLFPGAANADHQGPSIT